MLAFLLLSGCLIETDRYERRRAELLAEAEDDTGPDDSGHGDTGEECEPVPVWVDADGDGFGNPDYPDERCAPFDGWVEDATDCDDGDPGVNPGAEEVCATGVDEDCDGELGECRWEGDISADAADAIWVGTGETFGIPAPVGDLSEDGGDELALVTGSAVYLLGDARGEQELASRTPIVTHDASASTSLLRAIRTDLNADGRGELAVVALSAEVVGPSEVYWLEHVVGGTATTAGARSALTGDDSDHTLGFTAATASDLTGDGVPEFVTTNLAQEGMSTVWLYQAEPSLAPVASIDGDVADLFGYALAVGDANDDGLDDLLVTAPRQEADKGIAYVFHGPFSGANSLDLADSRLVGGAPGDTLGVSLTFAPFVDADGDGDTDVLLGAWGASTEASEAGAAYLFAGPIGARLEVTDAVGTYLGSHAEAGMGWAVGGAGDVDRDGRGDLLLGAFPAGSSDTTGRTYLVYGPGTGTFQENELPVTFRPGAGGGRIGAAPTAIGDVDTDGFVDLLLLDQAAQAGSGAAYLLRGSSY